MVVIFGLLGVTPLTGFITGWLSSDPDAVKHLSHMSMLPWNWHLEPVLLSLTTIITGIAIYQNRTLVMKVQDAIANAIPTMQSLWDKFLASVTWGATRFADYWQRGSLRWYFTGILSFLAGMCWVSGRTSRIKSPN